MRIAIIGGGVSGLVAAYHLWPRHEISLFEARPTLGGHAHTINIDAGAESLQIDTGFIVFNEQNYPQFTKLLKELEVSAQPTSMSFSVCAEGHATNRSYEYNGTNLNGIFAQRRNLVDRSFLKLLAEVVRFNRLAKRLAAEPDDDQEPGGTVQEFLERQRFSDFFTRHYLLPMGAAIWSCPMSRFGRFPIKFLAKFCDNHGLLNLFSRPQWQVIRGGSRTYVEALAARLQGNIQRGVAIDRIERSSDQVLVKPRGGEPMAFDHVVLACHSDQALRLLAKPLPIEVDALRAVPYQTNVAVLHTDKRLMPRCQRAWASWNYRVAANPDEAPCVTYWMNRLQSLNASKNYFVTLNGTELIDPAAVLYSVHYEHPVFTATRRQPQLLNIQGVSYAGAYWGNGFHEDGVVSGMRVAAVLNSLVMDPKGKRPGELLAR